MSDNTQFVHLVETELPPINHAASKGQQVRSEKWGGGLSGVCGVGVHHNNGKPFANWKQVS
jgi:hypothetical protein